MNKKEKLEKMAEMMKSCCTGEGGIIMDPKIWTV